MILICFDGSDDARSAITHAAALLNGQPATVLTVWEPFAEVLKRSSMESVAMSPGNIDIDQIDSQVKEQAQQLAEQGARLARECGLAAQPRTRAQVTTIASSILTEAEAISAIAILMGSRGRSRVKSMLLGSVSHAVIQHADRMVSIVPSPQIAQQREHDRHKQARGHDQQPPT